MVGLKLVCLVLAANYLNCLIQCNALPTRRESDAIPRRTIAGVSVVDTELVRSAQQYARDHGNDIIYRHIMRSWLFGILLLQHNDTLNAQVDPEVHAVAAILRDVGLDRTPNSPIISHDRRFEIDGAIAARNFIRGHPQGRLWEERRVQLVWDAIALHAEPKIAPLKELDVQVVRNGIGLDAGTPSGGVTPDEYAVVMAEFPRGDFKAEVKDVGIWICTTKPQTTYGERLYSPFSGAESRVPTYWC
jgi:hypothetical protein